MQETLFNGLIVYFVLAIGYNFVSQLRLDIFGKKLAPTEPKDGMLVVSVVFLWFMIAPDISKYVYGIGALFFTYLIFRFGVLKHAGSYTSDGYSSRLAWLLAMGINVFGVVMFLIAIIDALTLP